jgi:carbonic anhydrase/acetyltransferase-like protein (isoleucine patch superfamily)
VTGIPGTVKREVSEEQVANMKRTAGHLVERAKMFKASGL